LPKKAYIFCKRSSAPPPFQITGGFPVSGKTYRSPPIGNREFPLGTTTRRFGFIKSLNSNTLYLYLIYLDRLEQVYGDAITRTLGAVKNILSFVKVHCKGLAKKTVIFMPIFPWYALLSI
jgi:hypothetical protein